MNMYEEKDRIVAVSDSGNKIGELFFVASRGQYTVIRISVKYEYSNYRVGYQLLDFFVKKVRKNGCKIFPKSIFAKQYFQKHPELNNILCKYKEGQGSEKESHD